MNWEAISAIGEIVAAIAVVVTLIYLTVQLKQNTSSLKANAYQGWMSANMQINSALSSPEQAKMIAAGNIDSANLTKDNYVSFGMLNISLMQMAQSIDYLYRTGSLDHELWKTEMNRAAGILSMPGVRQWWEAGGKTQLPPSFVKYIESIDPNLHYWDWEPEHGFQDKTKFGADGT